MAETLPNSNQLLVCSDAKCSMYMEIHIFQKKSMAIMNIIFFVTFMEIFAINVHATFTMPIISLHVTYCIRYHQISAQYKLIAFCSPASGGVILVLSCDMTNCIIFHIFHFFLASVASMCIHFCTIMYYVYLYRYVSL